MNYQFWAAVSPWFASVTIVIAYAVWHWLDSRDVR